MKLLLHNTYRYLNSGNDVKCDNLGNDFSISTVKWLSSHNSLRSEHLL